MTQVSSGVFPKSFLRGNCGLDSKCSLKKGCKSLCASDRAAQVRGKVSLGRDAGSTSHYTAALSKSPRVYKPASLQPTVSVLVIRLAGV
jgi:hypothetical protein